MNFQYLTDRLVLRIEQEQAADKVLAFYKKNKPYFDAFDQTRPFLHQSLSSGHIKGRISGAFKKTYHPFLRL